MAFSGVRDKVGYIEHYDPRGRLIRRRRGRLSELNDAIGYIEQYDSRGQLIHRRMGRKSELEELNGLSGFGELGGWFSFKPAQIFRAISRPFKQIAKAVRPILRPVSAIISPLTKVLGKIPIVGDVARLSLKVATFGLEKQMGFGKQELGWGQRGGEDRGGSEPPQYVDVGQPDLTTPPLEAPILNQVSVPVVVPVELQQGYTPPQPMYTPPQAYAPQPMYTPQVYEPQPMYTPQAYEPQPMYTPQAYESQAYKPQTIEEPLTTWEEVKPTFAESTTSFYEEASAPQTQEAQGGEQEMAFDNRNTNREPGVDGFWDTISEVASSAGSGISKGVSAAWGAAGKIPVSKMVKGGIDIYTKERGQRSEAILAQEARRTAEAQAAAEQHKATAAGFASKAGTVAKENWPLILGGVGVATLAVILLSRNRNK